MLMLAIGFVLGAALMLLRPRAHRWWFRFLMRVPGGTGWPHWWDRSWEWVAMHTTPPDGY